MRTLYYFLTFILSAFLLISCGTDSTPVYTLTSAAEPTEAGTVSQSAAEAEEGQTITLTANSNEHWVFQRWSGDYSGSQNPASVVMEGDKNVTALFEKREYPLTLNKEGEGVVNERVIASKTTDYAHGTTVELDAVAAAGWTFTGWEGDIEGDQTPVEVTINGETTITANFERLDFELEVTVEGEGEVEQEVVAAKTTKYPFETVVRLTAVPETDWEFLRWEGDATGTDPQVEITITDQTAVTAIFRHVNEGLQVKTFDTSRYTAELVNGDLSKGEILYRIVEKYDVEGRFTERIRYDEFGNITVRERIKYDSQGNVIEFYFGSEDQGWFSRTTITRNSDGQVVESIREDEEGRQSKEVLEYDSNGNLVEQRRYFGPENALGGIVTYEYDSQGNLVRRNDLDAEENLQNYTLYFYNANGDQIEVIRYDQNENVQYRQTYEYDSFGNVIENIQYDSEGNITSRSTYSFDSEGLILERELFGENNEPLFRIEYVRDAEGRIIEENTFEENKLSWKVTRNYNQDGIIIENYYEDFENGETYKQVFSELDANNYWRLEVLYKNEEPMEMSLRSIDYHNRQAKFLPSEMRRWIQEEQMEQISRFFEDPERRSDDNLYEYLKKDSQLHHGFQIQGPETRYFEGSMMDIEDLIRK